MEYSEKYPRYITAIQLKARLGLRLGGQEDKRVFDKIYPQGRFPSIKISFNKKTPPQKAEF